MDELGEWQSLCRLDFILTKTFFLCFSLVHQSLIDFDYKLDGDVLPVRNSCKYLGIYLSSDLTWTIHNQSIASKVHQLLGLFRRTIDSRLSIDCKQKLHVSLTLSHLTYCCPVWRPFLIKDINIDNILDIINRKRNIYRRKRAPKTGGSTYKCIET